MLCNEKKHVRLVDDKKVFSEFMNVLESSSRIGVDIEADSFHVYYEKVCLIQVSTDSGIWIVDPIRVDAAPMGEVFRDEGFEIVFHAGEFDVLSLKRDFSFEFNNVFDTQVAGMLLGLGQAGYARLVEDFFGVVLKKGQQRSDWGRRPLTPNQLVYASEDALYLLPLRDRLFELLSQRNRLADAQDAFSRICALEPRPKSFDPEGYRAIKGFRSLDSIGKSIVARLFIEREQRAQRIDRPPFRVFSNDVIIEIAKKRPGSLGELSRIKGLPEHTLRRFGRRLLSALGEAMVDISTPCSSSSRSLPGARRAEDALDPASLACYERLRRWRNQFARDEGVEGRVIFRNEELKKIAQNMPVTWEKLEELFGRDSHILKTCGNQILKLCVESSEEG